MARRGSDEYILQRNADVFIEKQIGLSLDYSVKDGNRWKRVSPKSNLNLDYAYRCKIKIYIKRKTGITYRNVKFRVQPWYDFTELHTDSRLRDSGKSEISWDLSDLTNSSNNREVTFYFRVKRRTLSPRNRVFSVFFSSDVNPRGGFAWQMPSMIRHGY